MKHKLFLLVVFFSFSLSSPAQTDLSEYTYVLIPQQFEFQKGKDQYQINTLLRHLFNKAGFNAIYDEELKDLPRCNGLFLDLDDDSNFLNTTIQILLKDCNNNIVYRSPPGRSKEKDYKKSYHEAIRMSFEIIGIMGVNQVDLESFRESIEKRDAAVASAQTRVVKEESMSKNSIKSKSLEAYEFNGEKLYLESNNNDFVIYKLEKNNQDYVEYGKLIETSRPGIYLFTKDGKSLLANFDAEDNLLIDGVDNQGNPIQNKYQKVKDN